MLETIGAAAVVSVPAVGLFCVVTGGVLMAKGVRNAHHAIDAGLVAGFAWVCASLWFIL